MLKPSVIMMNGDMCVL